MNCANCGQTANAHTDRIFCPTNDKEALSNWYTGEAEMSDFDTYKPEFPKYLNVYEVTQAYGGPEEGGWWYDAGTPLESIRVDNGEQEGKIRESLQRRYEVDDFNNYTSNREEGGDVERIRGRTSAAGGYDVVIRTEYEFARPFPQERPRYE